MSWKHSSAQALKKLVGVYALPGGCWAVLTLHPAPAKTEEMRQACPEGYDYAHRAHRHLPDWKRLKMIGQQEWPEAGPGVQLASAPQTPQAFWLACMDCLEHALSGLGLDMPQEDDLMQSHMSEDDFRRIQDSIGSEPGPRPTG